MSPKPQAGDVSSRSSSTSSSTSQLTLLSVSGLLAAATAGGLLYYLYNTQDAANDQQQPRRQKRASKQQRQSSNHSSAPAEPPPEAVQLRGYTNLGNTCFLNALLQALASQPLFLNYLHQHVQLASTSHDSASHQSLLLSSTHPPSPSTPLLVALHHTLLQSTGKSSNVAAGTGTTIQQFYRTLVTCAPQFRGFQQNDAHELYVSLLELVEQYGKDCHQQTQQTPSLFDVIQRISAKQDASSHSTSSAVPPLSTLPFNGSTINLLQCSTCGYASTLRTTNFNCLSLSLPYTQLNSTYTIQQLLSTYTARDEVRDVKCSNCCTITTYQYYYKQLKQHVQQQGKMNERDWQRQLKTLKSAVLHWRQQQSKYMTSATTPKEDATVHQKEESVNGTTKHDSVDTVDVVKENKQIIGSTDSTKDAEVNIIQQLIDHTPLPDTQVSSQTSAHLSSQSKPTIQHQPQHHPELTQRRIFYKSLLINQLPQCLCLHINRLMGDIKLENYVGFPMQLNMAMYCAQPVIHYADRVATDVDATGENNSVEGLLQQYIQSQASTQLQPIIYQLTAVVVHLGRSGSGHYVTYRRHSKYQTTTAKDTSLTVPSTDESTWSMISDSSVRSNIEVDEVRRASAYLLFYHRVGQ